MTYIVDPDKPILGVDVDLTTLRSDRAWWVWLKHMTKNTTLPDSIDEFIEDGNEVDYYIPTHFGEVHNDNVDVMDFWRNEGVYDTIEPVEGAVESITNLMEYYNIVFVTHNKGNGGRSKFNNLVRHFGKGNFGQIVTKEKYLARIDALVDDRNDFLNNCIKTEIGSIKINTPFKQHVEAHPHLVELNTWEEIEHLLIESSTFFLGTGEIS